ncbi:hypothetical protein OIU76_025413 [Salix suchowensis]|nr:hypothetical protein OIU76_025413 [Salix suchowensis]
MELWSVWWSWAMLGCAPFAPSPFLLGAVASSGSRALFDWLWGRSSFPACFFKPRILGPWVLLGSFFAQSLGHHVLAFWAVGFLKYAAEGFGFFWAGIFEDCGERFGLSGLGFFDGCGWRLRFSGLWDLWRLRREFFLFGLLFAPGGLGLR